MPDEIQTTNEHPLKGLSIDALLDRLPLYAGVVSRTMKDATDGELQAWSWGIKDTQEHVGKLIAEWRLLNGA